MKFCYFLRFFFLFGEMRWFYKVKRTALFQNHNLEKSFFYNLLVRVFAQLYGNSRKKRVLKMLAFLLEYPKPFCCIFLGKSSKNGLYFDIFPYIHEKSQVKKSELPNYCSSTLPRDYFRFGWKKTIMMHTRQIYC